MIVDVVHPWRLKPELRKSVQGGQAGQAKGNFGNYDLLDAEQYGSSVTHHCDMHKADEIVIELVDSAVAVRAISETGRLGREVPDGDSFPCSFWPETGES